MKKKGLTELEKWHATVTRRRFLLGVGFAAASVYAKPFLGEARGALPECFGSVTYPTSKPPPGWPKPPVSFVQIGDFGSGKIHDSNETGPQATINPNAQNVAEGVCSYAKITSKAYVISVGDNVYVPYYGKTPSPPPDAVGTNNPPGNITTFEAQNITPYDEAVGALYGHYIKFPAGSTSVHAAHGSKKQRFFTVIGDHDWWHQPRISVSNQLSFPFDSATYPASTIASQPKYFPDNQPEGTSYYAQYFGNQGEGSSSGNTRYWDFVEDTIHWIGLSSDANEILLGTLSNGYYVAEGFDAAQDNLKNSTQGKWFQQVVKESKKVNWRFVVTHYAPYTSTRPDTGGHNPALYMQWGYESFDVDMVFSGHAHSYERLYVGGVTYVVSGAGGTFESFADFATPEGGPSERQVPKRFGFLTAERSTGKIFFSYISIPPHSDSTTTITPELSDRFVLLKKGTISAGKDFAELQSIHVTSGGGAVTGSKDWSYAGDLLGTGVLDKRGRGDMKMMKASPNFQGVLNIISGSVTLGVDGALGEESGLALSGGTLDATAMTQDFLKPLSLQKTSTLVVNSGSAVSFGDSSQTSWKKSAVLIVQGAPGATGLRFGTSASALTSQQLSQVRYLSKRGPVGTLDANGYLVFSVPGVGTTRKVLRVSGGVE